MAESLGRRGWVVDVEELDDSFPFPTKTALSHASEVIGRIRSGSIVLVDGLAFGAMPDILAEASGRLAFVVLLHLPLAATMGLPPAAAFRLAQSERRALSHATRVIVTGVAGLSLMKDFDLAHPDVMVVEPGTSSSPLSAGSGCADPQLLAVATLNAGKGYEILLRALGSLPHRNWRLVCAGSLTRHPDAAEDVRALIAGLGLGAHVFLTGELCESALEEVYSRSDVFVLASLRDTYGRAVAEALAHGLPIVATTTGAIPTLVGNDAGLVVPPGDCVSLRAALSRMIDDRVFRASCAAGARRVRERLPNWDQAAQRLDAVLRLRN
jgi:glycosyltransferase involved in cell wall biosynthesis